MSPISRSCHTFEEYYHINAHTFEKRYKETLSGYRDWEQLGHAGKRLLFPESTGPRLAIDGSSLSDGGLYTFITSLGRHTREGSPVAVVAGTRSGDVAHVLRQVGGEVRVAVEEVTPGQSGSMRRIVPAAFPKAKIVIDRFHIQKPACGAVQEIRVAHRWNALRQSNEEMEVCRHSCKPYVPFRFSNGDTRPELLIRSRYLLFKSADKRTERQKERARILFGEYPDIRIAYGLSHPLRMTFSKNTIKDAARLGMARWYNKVEQAGMKQFNVIAATLYGHYDEILNLYNNRSSNAAAESFNDKIKLFRTNLHGVVDKKFFLY